MKPFNDRHAREILEPCGINDYITIDERGVWPKVQYDATDGTNLFRWRTARVFQGEPGAPEVADTPMLPFEFIAGELAAFMLEGVGALVSGFYGDYANGPDPASLNAIDPDSHARTAIIQAYAARREAEQVVGGYPLELEAKADRARKAYQLAHRAANIREGVSDSIPGTDDSRDRRARAVASIAQQDAEMEATALAWKQGYEAWLNAMVRHLLRPAQIPAPVGDTKPDVTLMATRQHLIDAFGSFTGMDASWFSNIKDTPALLAARKVIGQGGRHFVEPLFCPFEVLQWLIDPARRKGRPLGQDKGWELFERNFPRAYAAFSVGDTRTD